MDLKDDRLNLAAPGDVDIYDGDAAVVDIAADEGR
jgi:hypothetical protein